MSFRDPLVEQIAVFLSEIGLEVRAGAVGSETALPGIDVDHGALIVDEARLLYPGDLLHEAGHLAVAPPATRATLVHDVGKDGGDETMAIAWSYAAACHLNIDPAIVTTAIVVAALPFSKPCAARRSAFPRCNGWA